MKVVRSTRREGFICPTGQFKFNSEFNRKLMQLAKESQGESRSLSEKMHAARREPKHFGCVGACWLEDLKCLQTQSLNNQGESRQESRLLSVTFLW